MNPWWPRSIILLLIVVLVGLPVLLHPQPDGAASQGATTALGESPRLVIVSPHNEQIRFELGRAFNEHRVERGLPAIEFDWRSSGGTSDLRKQVLAEFTEAARAGREDAGIGKDLFFGGGEYEHNVLAKGVTVERGGRAIRISTTVPIPLPPGMLEEVFPEPMVGGERLYHPQLHWVGAVLASFGIVYNRDVLGMLEVPEPTTWTDLQDPRLYRWVALADPSHSGSIAAAYDAMLRRLGWEEGWRVLRRTFGNARYVTSSAGKVPVDVSTGEAAAGMSIDFYGRYQAGAVGGNRVGYVDPPRMTSITADPISILRGAPEMELAQQFVVWLLSREAQLLWQRKLGTVGGPTRFELRRLPVRRDLYTPAQMADWNDPVPVFEIASPLPPDMPSFFLVIAPVAKAMAIDVHDDLRSAWQALNQARAQQHRHLARMQELFDAMPPELQVAWPDEDAAANWAQYMASADHPRHAQTAAAINNIVGSLLKRWEQSDQRSADQLAWTKFFRDNYREIVRLSRE